MKCRVQSAPRCGDGNYETEVRETLAHCSRSSCSPLTWTERGSLTLGRKRWPRPRAYLFARCNVICAPRFKAAGSILSSIPMLAETVGGVTTAIDVASRTTLSWTRSKRESARHWSPKQAKSDAEVTSPMSAPRLGGDVIRVASSPAWERHASVTPASLRGGVTSDMRWRHLRQEVTSQAALRCRHPCRTKLSLEACLEASHKAHALAMSTLLGDFS
jgi:hypothetical protein